MDLSKNIEHAYLNLSMMKTASNKEKNDIP